MGAALSCQESYSAGATLSLATCTLRPLWRRRSKTFPPSLTSTRPPDGRGDSSSATAPGSAWMVLEPSVSPAITRGPAMIACRGKHMPSGDNSAELLQLHSLHCHAGNPRRSLHFNIQACLGEGPLNSCYATRKSKHQTTDGCIHEQSSSLPCCPEFSQPAHSLGAPSGCCLLHNTHLCVKP